MKLGAPHGFRARIIRLDGDEFAVLDFPLAHPVRPPELTAAEAEVFDLIVNGASNAEIAKRRRTSVRTVANQIASIFTKARVASRAELVAHCPWDVLGPSSLSRK